MNIIVDTREKRHWNFNMYKSYGIIHKKLDAGDYSIEGYEDILSIERKASTGELGTNIGKKRKQFESELELMSKMKYKYLLCEFTLDNLYEFPKNSGIPKSKWKYVRMNGKFMVKSLYDWVEEFDIDLHFCGNKFNACQKAIEIFNEVKLREES